MATIYHSHIDAGAYFSETDKRNALVNGEPAYPTRCTWWSPWWAGGPRAPMPSRGIRPAATSSRSSSPPASRPAAPDARHDPVRVALRLRGAPHAGRRQQPRPRVSRRRRARRSSSRAPPARASRTWTGAPTSTSSARGARSILGHAHPSVVEALGEAARRGTSYGAPTEGEVEMAALIARAMPSMEMLRLVSSGTEAAMSAIRLARGATGRDLVVKFDGCYHGHADSLLVKAGSGGATFGVPDSRRRARRARRAHRGPAVQRPRRGRALHGRARRRGRGGDRRAGGGEHGRGAARAAAICRGSATSAAGTAPSCSSTR